MGLLGTAALGIGKGLMSIFGQSAANKQNLAAQQQLMQQQNAYNKELLEMQNRYNSPAHQRMLLEQGGLNPDLLYGNSPASFQSAEAHPAAAGTVPPPVGVQNAVDSAFAAPMQLAQAMADIRSRKLDNETKEVDLITRLDENITRLEAAKSNAKDAATRADLEAKIKNTKIQREKLITSGVEQDNVNRKLQGDIMAETKKQEVMNTAMKSIDTRYHEQNVKTALQTAIRNSALLSKRLRLSDVEYTQLCNAIAKDGVELIKADNDKAAAEWFTKHLGKTGSSILYGIRDSGQSVISAVAGFLGLGKIGAALKSSSPRKFSKARVSGNTIDWE
nr:MAG: DNA pilot protein [Microvirus Sku12]